MKYWKLTLTAAATAFAVPLVFVSSAAMKVVDGWNIKGMQEGVDTVTVERAADGAPMLRIQKKSAYQPGRFLFAFKNFSGVAWRARRIRMRYDIEAKGSVDHSDNEPVLVRISMQCGQYSDSTLETARSLDGKQSRYLDFKVPHDAAACSYGFTTAIVSSILVKSLRFEEADPAPS
jgi:hypothetical protein